MLKLAGVVDAEAFAVAGGHELADRVGSKRDKQGEYHDTRHDIEVVVERGFLEAIVDAEQLVRLVRRQVIKERKQVGIGVTAYLSFLSFTGW
jgi:hypothetical protein